MTASQVNLIVASMDLNKVQSVIRAMRAADKAAERTKPPLTYEERHPVTPTPQVEPRKVIHPTPQVEPRKVIHPSPVYQTALHITLPAPSDVVHSHITPSPIVPPWKQLPWQKPVEPPPVVKQVVYKTKVINKGSLLDFVV